MIKKLMPIDSCFQCRNIGEFSNTAWKTYFCQIKPKKDETDMRKISNPLNIPSWCPLKDSEEKI